MTPFERMRMATLKTRTPRIVRNTITNLKRSGTVAAATLGGTPLAGSAAVVVGAGPSLARQLDALRGMTGKAAVFAVNTAAPKLYAEGIRPDYLVCIESLPMSAQVEPDRCGAVIADMGACPQTFAKADYWVLNQSPHNMPLLYELGVPPLHGGQAAMVTAAQLAIDWGASTVALVGVDLAYDVRTGRAYADGSGWSGLRVRVEGEQLVFDGREDRDALHRDNGVPAAPRRRPGIRLKQWGGKGHVWTTLELESQRAWLERVAQVHGDRDLVNASKGGARIAGWREVTLKKVPIGEPPREPERVCLDPGPALDRIRHEAEGQCMVGAKWLEGPPDWSMMEGMADGRLFVDGLAAGDLVGLGEQRMDPPARLRAVYEVFKAAGEAARKEVG